MGTTRAIQGTLLPLFVLFAGHLIAQFAPAQFETLDSVAERNPDEVVIVLVKFNSIQREPSVTAMLQGSNLRLEELQYKFVGSGGGSTRSLGLVGGQPSMLDVTETFSQARQQHRMFFQGMIDPSEGIRRQPCTVDDASAPLIDTHGTPGDPHLELACGLRISGIKLSGTATAATRFREAHSNTAQVTREPSPQEVRAFQESVQ